MGKKHRQLAEEQARLETKIDRVAAAVGQPQRESTWTRFNIVATLILATLTLVLGTWFASRQLRQGELANVISAEPKEGTTLGVNHGSQDSALAKWGRGEFTDTAVSPEKPPETRKAAPRPAPVLVGVMQADSGKVDSAVAQLAAASSPIIPMDSAGNPYVRAADGRARVQIAAAGATDGGSAAGGAKAGDGSLRKGLWEGPYGELICAGACMPGQVCCEDLSGIQP